MISVSRQGRFIQGSTAGPDSVFCEWRTMSTYSQTDRADTGDGEGTEVYSKL